MIGKLALISRFREIYERMTAPPKPKRTDHPLTVWRMSLPNNENSLAIAAQILGTSASMLYRYEQGLRKLPAEKAVRYSYITGIPRKELRPDIFFDE